MVPYLLEQRKEAAHLPSLGTEPTGGYISQPAMYDKCDAGPTDLLPYSTDPWYSFLISLTTGD